MSIQTFAANSIQARKCLAQMSLLRVDMRLTIEKTRETICKTREAMAQANDLMGEESPAAIDPNECRANAARCVEMASRANGDVSTQNTLFDVAKTWTFLAGQMERRAAARIVAPVAPL